VGWKKAAAVAGAGTLLVSTATLLRSSEPPVAGPVISLKDKVSILTLTLNEEHFIERTLKSLRNQDVIKNRMANIEMVLVDSNSDDRTVEIAVPYVDRFVMAPRGKLTAKNLAVLQADADIIVATDGDSYYPEFWLNHLLKHFRDPEVIAVHGPVLPIEDTSGFYAVGYSWSNLFRPVDRISGRNSAFRRRAFLNLGGFDESIDQLNRDLMIYEEEKRFLQRLKSAGKVVFEWNAGIYTSTREKMLTNGSVPMVKYKTERAAGVRF